MLLHYYYNHDSFHPLLQKNGKSRDPCMYDCLSNHTAALTKKAMKGQHYLMAVARKLM